MKVLCSSCGRERELRAREMCGSCYNRNWREATLPEMYAETFRRHRMANTVVDPETGCWLWQGETYNGYGWSCLHSKSEFLHRASFLLFNGPLKPGQIVRHTCDVRRCWNPGHLVAGTHKDNMQDAVSRGRMQRGEARHNAVLTEAKVREVRLLLQEGKYHREIAEMMGCTRLTIHKVAHGKTWAHVK